ncbi:uncharacterized protein LOC143032488 isoform X2 [Oratosquilla oratoria]|uniref:uncharacterized protein LOC143032488 isoform X2 n=1 Tax=Oratosquilla oratoria TaxID=337810 RepID=UPI003F76A98A
MKVHFRCTWRTLALILGTLAAMMALVLALTLGILLTSLNERGCGEPPTATQAFWNFTGKSEVGTKVALICPAPLIFPDNSSRISTTCTKNLRWTPPQWSTCVRKLEQWCELETRGSLPHLRVTVHLLDRGTDLSVKVILRGKLTSLMHLDLDTSDMTNCHYGHQDINPQEVFASGGPLMTTKLAAAAVSSVHFLQIQDSVIDPALPYEVRLRGVGSTVSLGLVQGSHINVTIFHIQEETSVAYALNRNKHLFLRGGRRIEVGVGKEENEEA